MARRHARHAGHLRLNEGAEAHYWACPTPRGAAREFLPLVSHSHSAGGDLELSTARASSLYQRNRIATDWR